MKFQWIGPFVREMIVVFEFEWNTKASYEEGESGRNKAKNPKTGVPDFGMGASLLPFYSWVRSMH